jgi:hypothetical protein
VKVGHVMLSLGAGLSGVDGAFLGQARASDAEGRPVDLLVVSGGEPGERNGIRHLRYRELPLVGSRGASYLKAHALASARELEEYDVLFVRYPTAVDLAPLALLERFPGKVVTVHHTKEVEELASARSPATVGRALVEWIQGRRVLGRVHGIVGVTDEIRHYELGRIGRQVTSRTISNGIDVDRVPLTGFRPFRGDVLHLLFVASTHVPWHGTDRVLAALRRHRGPPHVVLHLVGGGSGAPAGTIEQGESTTIRHHGPLHGDELDRVCRAVTLAFGSLALHRKRLRQACTLKTREYIARGLPFALAYDDVDVPPSPFALQLPPGDAPIELGPLFDFAESVSRSDGLSDAMRAYAHDHLDWRLRVRAFRSFAEELASR